MPQLIAHLDVGFGPSFICPECRSDKAQRFQISPTPADVFFTEAELFDDNKLEGEAEETEDVPPMSWRNHFRAFLRWWTPWEEETRLWLCTSVTLLSFFTLVASLVTWNLDSVQGMLLFPSWIAAAFLIWRAALTVLFLLIAIITKDGFKGLGHQWKEMGQEPLFKTIRREIAYSRDWRQSAKWLQSRGMSRRDARESARSASRARVASEILKTRKFDTDT